jgi:hypothetical protein
MEETMRKSLVLIATAVGGGMSYAAGMSEVATGPSTDEPSTWRWQVSSILAVQGSRDVHRAETVAEAFNQRYVRYTPLGLPQSRGDLR